MNGEMMKKTATGTETMAEWQTEKHNSFSTAVKVLTFILGLGVALVAVCVYAMFSGCGGGSGNSTPIYNENGVCVENCGNGDASVMPVDGYIYPPADISSPEPDYVAPPCKVPADPAIKKMCMPYWAQISKCIAANSAGAGFLILCGSPEDGLDGKDCYCYGEKAYDPETNGAKSCDTVADCQPITCEEWPPEVCWGLPCQLVGKWQCPSSVQNFTDLEFYDNGDGYCRIHSPTYSDNDLYYKPGDDHLQYPPSGGPIEKQYTILDDGNQLLGDGGAGVYTCTKLTEE